MLVTLIVFGVVFVVWILMNLKTSRPDGALLDKVPKYRTMMGYIMRTRSESVVYFDAAVRAEPLLDYIAESSDEHRCNITHCLLYATARGMQENPKMNRFIVGRRLYERNGIHITFSMKRTRLTAEGVREAKLAAAKMEIHPGGKDADFRALCERVNQRIGVERSGEKTYTDKELDLLTVVPRALLIRGVGMLEWLNHHNCLPASFIEGDAMFTSAFVANLGSLKMGAGFHHLYEWGTCPLFIMAGQIEDRPTVEDGEVVVRKILPLRFSYDERIADGLNARHGIDSMVRILENPFEEIGAVSSPGDAALDRESAAPIP